GGLYQSPVWIRAVGSGEDVQGFKHSGRRVEPEDRSLSDCGVGVVEGGAVQEAIRGATQVTSGRSALSVTIVAHIREDFEGGQHARLRVEPEDGTLVG